MTIVINAAQRLTATPVVPKWKIRMSTALGNVAAAGIGPKFANRVVHAGSKGAQTTVSNAEKIIAMFKHAGYKVAHLNKKLTHVMGTGGDYGLQIQYLPDGEHVKVSFYEDAE